MKLSPVVDSQNMICDKILREVYFYLTPWSLNNMADILQKAFQIDILPDFFYILISISLTAKPSLESCVTIVHLYLYVYITFFFPTDDV